MIPILPAEQSTACSRRGRCAATVALGDVVARCIASQCEDLPVCLVSGGRCAVPCAGCASSPPAGAGRGEAGGRAAAGRAKRA